MKIKRGWFGFFLALIWSLAIAAEPFEEGKHYQLKKVKQDNAMARDLVQESKGKVQVLEFFSYGCHWCQKLDPYVEAWHKKAPGYVEFQRIPVEFQPAWGPLSKAYYTQLDLKAQDKIHTPLFEAIHVTNQITQSSEGALRDFFVSKGIKADDFNKTFNSFNVTNKYQWANVISQAYQITTVPMLVVQGPAGVYATSLRLAGDEQNLFKIVDFLVEKEKAALDQAHKAKK